MERMPTFAEIVGFHEKTKDDDVFGFQADVLLRYLPESYIRPYLKDGVEWTPRPYSREHVIADMREYMVFAWEKALGERGLSAARSIEKMRAWLWLLGDVELLEELLTLNYAPYGRPILHRICRKYRFPSPKV